MKAPFITVRPGALVTDAGEESVVLRFVDADRVLIRNLASKVERAISIDSIASSSAKTMTEELDFSRKDLLALSPEEWASALAAFNAIKPLLTKVRPPVKLVEEVAADIGVNRATIYRWIKRFRETGTITAFLPKRRTDLGAVRLDAEVEKTVAAVIEAEYLGKQKKSIKAVHAKLMVALQKAGQPEVHYNTLRNRILAMPSERVAQAREGHNAALRHRLYEGTVPNASYPYELIQIDHTKVDIILVDSVHRTPIGRPWITVAIDVFSRMIVGWYVALDPPGDLSTGICICNAILPKRTLLAELELDYAWPCQGKPAVIQADNAKEFRGHMLDMACQEHLIDMRFRQRRKPQYGAHIESYMGTLAKEIHSLPGTTFSNAQDKGEYDAEGNAIMTLDDFQRWLGHLILGKYHNETHSALGMPPIEKYRRGILGDDQHMGVGYLPIAAEPAHLRLDFLPYEERTVQPYGILLDNIFYFADVLRVWVGARENGNGKNKRKFIVRRDPRDISKIWFYDPDLQKYFPIPYRNLSRPVISLWELRAATAMLKKDGKSAEDEDTIFAALEAMWAIERAASTATKQARRNSERGLYHKIASQTLADRQTEKSSSAEHSSDDGWDTSLLKPFEE